MGINPYWGSDFGHFFLTFFQRIGYVLSGQIPMASDELQILTLFLIGISTSLLGTFLVLKRSTMLANSLSHTTLLGIAIVVITANLMAKEQEGMILSFSLMQLICAGLITASLTLYFTRIFIEKLAVQTDASIGLVFSFFFALGIVLITMYTRNLHIGTEAIMGNVDALHRHDLNLVLGICLFNGVILIAYFPQMKMIAFDTEFSKGLGLPLVLFEGLILLQTTFTMIGGFRAVGVILILAFLTAPVLIARFFTKRLISLILYSIGVTLFSSFVSVALSRHLLSVEQLAVSTSGLNVLFLLLFFILSATLKHFRNLRGKQAVCKSKSS